ncbi:hypothetical protein D3C86_2114650 [compost metagenome]
MDETAITCNTFTLEWPPKSGKMIDFPEVDKAGWFSLSEAKAFINEQQQSFLEELENIIK